MRRAIMYIPIVSLVCASLAACAHDESLTQPTLTSTHTPSRAILPQRNPEDFTAITAGADFTCAMKRNLKVYCWGLNDRDQTGVASSVKCTPIGIINVNNSSANGLPCVGKPSPVFFGGDSLRAIQIDAGHGHACALDNVGDAVCWGDGNAGQVGNGLYGSFMPTKVSGGLQVWSIGAGGASSCATTSTGIFCWGTIQNNVATPQLVSTVTSFFGDVTVGNEHACVMDFTGGVYGAVDCWGVNSLGQLANPISGPAAFAVRAGFGTSVNRVTTEGNFTCVDQSNGTVQCAGDNTFGTLGNAFSGTFTSTSTPQTVGWNVFRPGWQTLHGVTASTNHACALDQSNYAWCWGDNNAGQLGFSTGSGTIAPSPGAVTGGITFRALAAGELHTCGIGTDNHIYCWGANNNSQLGQYNTQGPVAHPIPAIDP